MEELLAEVILLESRQVFALIHLPVISPLSFTKKLCYCFLFKKVTYNLFAGMKLKEAIC